MPKKHKSVRLHDKLMKQNSVYAKWHKHPLQALTQWVILVAMVVGIGYLLVNRMEVESNNSSLSISVVK